MWPLRTPELLRVESLCGILGNLHLGTWTFESGLGGTLGGPGSRLGAVAPNHPESLSEEPQAFHAQF